jgi:hypothetical protein
VARMSSWRWMPRTTKTNRTIFQTRLSKNRVIPWIGIVTRLSSTKLVISKINFYLEALLIVHPALNRTKAWPNRALVKSPTPS